MAAKFLLVTVAVLGFCASAYFAYEKSCDRMPLVTDINHGSQAAGTGPVAQRGPEFFPWLRAEVKIEVPRFVGSGTIVYYDHSSGYAYVQSCGHLWEGNMTAEEGRARKLKATIVTFYTAANHTAPTKHSAEVLYYDNGDGTDISLLRFKPRFLPACVPIAPVEFDFVPGMRFRSLGCDGGSECAHYDVRCLGVRIEEGTERGSVVTTENSPRKGRSGGGLSTDICLVGVCWGTSAKDGTGLGFFTPLPTIREFNERNGFGFLNEHGRIPARSIPIIDRNNPKTSYPHDYIPLPSSKARS